MSSRSVDDEAAGGGWIMPRLARFKGGGSQTVGAGRGGGAVTGGAGIGRRTMVPMVQP